MDVSEAAVRLAHLQRELDELMNSLPAHSLSPAMLIRIEDLESEIHQLTQIVNVNGRDNEE